MAHHNVFLSSPTGCLAEYRQVVYRAIEGLRGCHCVRMEDFGALDWQADEFCQARIAECDLFVGILVPLYGSSPPGRDDSYSEREYDAAVAAEMPRLMFMSTDDFSVPARFIEPDNLRKKQEAFADRVRPERICNSFSSADDLAGEVRPSIHNWEPRVPVGSVTIGSIASQ